LLSQVAGGETCKPGALADQILEMRGGDQLRVRLSMHVDELGKEVLHALFLDQGLDLLTPDLVRSACTDRQSAPSSWGYKANWKRIGGAMWRKARLGIHPMCA